MKNYKILFILSLLFIIGCSYRDKAVIDYVDNIGIPYAHKPNSQSLPIEGVFPNDTLKKGDTVIVDYVGAEYFNTKHFVFIRK